MILLDRDKDIHVGKTISEIKADGFGTGLTLCEQIDIVFTDGSKVILRTDWRGQDCYISEYTNETNT
jgi:hypothetical protein